MFKSAVLALGCCVLAVGQTPAPAPQVRTTLIQAGEAAPFAFTSVAAPFVWTSMETAPLVLNGSPVIGAPYTAQAVTTRTQVLADGNRIQQKSSTTIARDSQGRVRSERSLQGPSGEEDMPKLVTIEDPVSGSNYSLDAMSKTAFKMPARPAPNMISPDAKPVVVAPAAPHVEVRKDRLTSPDVKTTDLGAQTIEGLLVQGKRTTRTIPAGAIGNDREIVITTETWYSPDLQVLVSTKSDDPRMGETSYQLTNIQRSEPAASLFQVPSDYAIKDQPGNVVYKRTMGPK